MKFQVKYSSTGQTYEDYVEVGTANIKHHSKVITAWFRGNGKSQGKFVISKDEAERLAHALLLACSAEDQLIQFPFGAAKK
jgi:hypothetical protein